MSRRSTTTASPDAQSTESVSKRRSRRLPFPVVAIGASAGGIEALRILLAHLPGTLEAALVVVTHLPANKKSHMQEVLASFTTLPVHEIGENTILEPGAIYTVPSGWDVGIEKGRLKLLSPGHDLHYHRPLSGQPGARAGKQRCLCHPLGHRVGPEVDRDSAQGRVPGPNAAAGLPGASGPTFFTWQLPTRGGSFPK